MKRLAIAATSALLLTACQNEPAAEVPDDDSTEAESPNPAEPVSIIRPDIEEAVMIPLEALELTVSFADSGTELTDTAIADLEALLSSRQAIGGGSIVIGGHSDAGGTDAINQRISLERAQAVADWLVAQGVSEDRITVIAFGEQNPVEPNALPNGEPNEAGRAANRRVELRVDAPEGAMVEAAAKPAAEAEQ